MPHPSRGFRSFTAPISTRTTARRSPINRPDSVSARCGVSRRPLSSNGSRRFTVSCRICSDSVDTSCGRLTTVCSAPAHSLHGMWRRAPAENTRGRLRDVRRPGRWSSSYTWDGRSTVSLECGSCGGSREVRATPPHARRVFMQQRRVGLGRDLVALTENAAVVPPLHALVRARLRIHRPPPARPVPATAAGCPATDSDRLR